MNSIDWSKAPEGATHYGAATYSNNAPEWCEAFYKNVGDCWMICFPESGGWHGDASRNDDWKERFATLIERPAAWTGEGVPPKHTRVVIENPKGYGLVCDESEWLGPEVTVVHSYRNMFDIDLVVVERDDGAAQVFRASMCRPVRTSDRIAEEEREAAVKEMQVVVNSTPLAYMGGLYALYDAGYRKVQP